MSDNEDTYVIRYMTGTVKLEPVEHRITWLSHDEFKMESDIMTMTNCHADDLPMMLTYFWPIKFLNERPDAPVSWLRRLFS